MDLSFYFPPLAVQAGLTCMTAHIVLAVLFAFVLPKGPWTALPNSTAHQVVCLPLMIYLVYHGWIAWFSSEQDELYAEGMTGRIFGVSPRGADMSAVVWGMMILWDIPLSLFVPALQNTLMLGHHLGMCFVSGVSMGVFSGGHPIGSYYAAFFYGIVEISSIFLTIVDMFHPKNKEWFEYVNQTTTPVGKMVQTVNELSRVAFAVAFLVLRCGKFPYIMVTTCLADFWTAANVDDAERYGIPRWTLLLVFALCFAFTLLQLNWGVLVGRQVGKAIGLIPDGKKEETKTQ